MQPLVQLTPGMVFAGDYEVLRPLAQGGMGAVYVVRQRSTAKQRALKVLHPQFAMDGPSRERFVQEARVAAEIDSDHVTEVVGAGVDPATNTPWIAMELLDGEELAVHVERVGALSAAAVYELCDQLCDALAKAHAKGIVHRDLKPENLFVAKARRRGVPFTVKVLDFGIAKAVADNATAAKVSRTIGSPLWMAPEQAQLGARLNPATDVWALGLIVFYLLTGKYYWRAPNAGAADLMTVLNEVMLTPLDPASARAREYGVGHLLPAGFDRWFARCVDRYASRRWADASAAWEALVPVLSQTQPLGQGQVAEAATGMLGTQAVSMPPAAPVGVTQAWQSTVSTPVSVPAEPRQARVDWRVAGIVAGVAVVGGGLGIAGFALSGSSRAPESGLATSAPSAVLESASGQQTAAPPLAAPAVDQQQAEVPPTLPRADRPADTSARSAPPLTPEQLRLLRELERSGGRPANAASARNQPAQTAPGSQDDASRANAAARAFGNSRIANTCWQQLLRLNPSVSARSVRITLSVNAQGSFTSVSVSNSPDPRFDQCVGSRVATIAPLEPGPAVESTTTVSLAVDGQRLRPAAASAVSASRQTAGGSGADEQLRAVDTTSPPTTDGTLAVSTRPSSVCTIPGRPAFTTPRIIVLPAGTYRFRCVNEDLRMHGDFVVDVRPRERTVFINQTLDQTLGFPF